MRSADPALETLWLPFDAGQLRWPGAGGALFMGARAGWPLQGRALPGLACEQAWKPEAEALARQGFACADASHDGDEPTPRYPLVLLLPPRQREQARAWFARALGRLAPGGIAVACMANKEGAKSGEADLARLAGPLRSESKHHCRVFWSAPLEAPADPALADAWRTLDAPRWLAEPGVPGGRFLSRPGVGTAGFENNFIVTASGAELLDRNPMLYW